MLRWMTPFLVAIFAIGTAAAEAPEPHKPPMAPQRQSLPTQPRPSLPTAPASKPHDSPATTTRRQPGRGEARRQRCRRQARHGSRRQPVAARPAACALQLPDHGCPASSPLYVRRGRTLVVEEEVCRADLASSRPMRRASSARRCCRAHRRCPAITGQAIPTAMTAPITAAPTSRTGTACHTLAACTDIVRRVLADNGDGRSTWQGHRGKTSKTGAANATTADLVARPRRRHRRRAQDHDHRQRQRAAERPVRICAPFAADGIAGMGRGADRPSARLCRAALHLRRSRTGRRCPVAAFDLDQLSGPDPRRPGRPGF